METRRISYSERQESRPRAGALSTATLPQRIAAGSAVAAPAGSAAGPSSTRTSRCARHQAVRRLSAT
ncbi:hypothetical protein HNP84_007828 [Thermocatellispora tengchongensis]|uniref:Uncharacterized protein n=1 Tax=Thermocatellispora tengchongensis TaxID=1073253 RepID=A0A840PPY8_9ACTN|nr:hypothetical protein [Thermocatellispora tengchongensis]